MILTTDSIVQISGHKNAPTREMVSVESEISSTIRNSIEKTHGLNDISVTLINGMSSFILDNEIPTESDVLRIKLRSKHYIP